MKEATVPGFPGSEDPFDGEEENDSNDHIVKFKFNGVPELGTTTLLNFELTLNLISMGESGHEGSWTASTDGKVRCETGELLVRRSGLILRENHG